jgi:hypothetical protein
MPVTRPSTARCAATAVGLNENNVDGSAVAFNSNRAFIQIAGFTIGLSQSFFDFYSAAATAYFGYYPGGDTGDGGHRVVGYTAQFGNGFSATLAAEQNRRRFLIDASATNPFPLATFGSLGAGDNDYIGHSWPDLVGNVRVDQAWGSAQLMGALHNVSANYYGTDGAPNLLAEIGHPTTSWASPWAPASS